MYLTREEEEIIQGEQGETLQQLMEILVGVGTVFGATKMIPVRSVQVSGASYKTIGKYGLEWLESLHARAVVPAVLNPIGMDRVRYASMSLTDEFITNQQAVIDAYARLGIQLECTCTPYYFSAPAYGEHIAWSESSAVCYSNSVCAARTNREGGPSALASALLGKTPYYGLHLIENRVPNMTICVHDAPKEPDSSWYGSLGYLVGKMVGAQIPYFAGIRPTRDQLKALGAAMAASGAVSLFHVHQITPESEIFHWDPHMFEQIPITNDEIQQVYRDSDQNHVDAIAIGCPHCSSDELLRIARDLEGKTVKKPLYIFASAYVLSRCPGEVAIITKAGGRVYADTCMVVSPEMEQYECIMVNSGKAHAYVPTMCYARSRIATLDECLAEACM
ncbi:MAG: aconitase X catalytic domain-containing protein [Methanomicrobiales archaeon]|jgi:predicted aconitase|nr:aconitase X catalytic domain-containing protein [Methanomicrobiales archaeon]